MHLHRPPQHQTRRLRQGVLSDHMGEIHEPVPVLLVVAVSSRYDAALQWARERIDAALGPLALVSDAFEFTETDYYTSTMGRDLKKQFVASQRLIDSAAVAVVKRMTNDWEAEYAALGRHPEPRPLNLDPGYITPAKLVLASTKDHAHRLHLRDGIYAEVTLRFQAGAFEPWPWTYADYREPGVHGFLETAREALYARILQLRNGAEISEDYVIS